MNIDVGKVIAGKYELVRLLGKGAMGEVWLATHATLGGEFAIKLVEPTDDMEAETAAGRFQLEAQIAAKLSRRTRHIVSVSDHGEEGGLAYLVMELLEGESLEARTRRVGPMPLPEAAAIVLQVARALSLAHEEGIFHRDLKPANVWLGRDEDGRLLVKLLDFGIARSKKPFRTRSPFATSKDMVLGTPSYMSPEQARGLDSLDFRCDLWALGVVAYEALTGRIPFEGETVEDIFLSICTFRVVPISTRRQDLPPQAEAFFARAFAPKLDDRFGTALELTAAFESLTPAERIEEALGVPVSPISSRRLEAARASAPSFTNEAPRASQPSFGDQVTVDDPLQGLREMRAERRKSVADFDLEAGSGVGPMSVGMDAPPRRNNGWLIAALALAALVGVGIIVLVAFSGKPSQPTLARTAEPPPSSSVAVTSAPTPTPSATPAAEPPPAVTAPPAKTAATAIATPRGTKPAAAPVPAPTPPPTSAPTPPPVVTAVAPPPAPTPPPRPHDKSETL